VEVAGGGWQSDEGVWTRGAALPCIAKTGTEDWQRGRLTYYRTSYSLMMLGCGESLRRA
jgi:hypothetical protein